jgi:hypothetical protein
MGFHGDLYLIDVVASAADRCGQFIETGTNVGNTIAYFAGRFPAIPCYSCEPATDAFFAAQKRTAELKNVTLANEPSPDFLYHLEKSMESMDTLFWLDAHGAGFRWPLQNEVAFITRVCPRACVLIDDFQVPGEPQFGFDQYDGQVCGFDYIKAIFQPDKTYRLTFPGYTERTSTFHPLRGWILIEWGYETPLPLPSSLKGKSQTIEWRP